MDNPYKISEDDLRISEGIWESYQRRTINQLLEGVPDEEFLNDPLMNVSRRYVSVTNQAITYLRSLDPKTIREAELKYRIEILRKSTSEGMGEEESIEDLAKRAFGLRDYTLEEMMQGEEDEAVEVNTIIDAESVFIGRGHATKAQYIRRVASYAWDIKNRSG